MSLPVQLINKGKGKAIGTVGTTPMKEMHLTVILTEEHDDLEHDSDSSSDTSSNNDSEFSDSDSDEITQERLEELLENARRNAIATREVQDLDEGSEDGIITLEGENGQP